MAREKKREISDYDTHDITELLQRLKELEDQNERLEATVKKLRQSTVIDVTDRMLAEQKIRKLSEELRNIIDSTDDIIWSVDLNNRLLYFNAAYKNAVKKTLGLTLKEGALMNELFPEEHETIWSDFYERAIKDGKFYVELKSPVEDKVFAYSIYPIRVNSEIVEITCFAKDITDRIKTEQKIVSENSILESTVRERTEELQHLVKDLQNFSLALSHDVKASYRDIELCAGNILRNTDIQANAERILQVSRDVTSLIDQIMNYEMYARTALVKDQVNIKKSIMSVFRELKTKYQNQPELAFETGFPMVSADKALLRQVVFNVLSNALKFSSKREKATIKIGCVEEDGEYVIYVKDNGVGFDMNSASNLFTPFVRMHDKEDYEGNGLGLSIVKNIIQRHGGRTWIESKPGLGTVVYFSLPINL